MPASSCTSIFADVEAILLAWHERHVASHLEHLAEVRDQAGGARERLEAVLEAYALISHQHHGTELAALLHRGEHVARAQQQLRNFIRDLLTEAAEAGDIRDELRISRSLLTSSILMSRGGRPIHCRGVKE
jgi:AcrR family transcriptional regulator